MAGQCVISGQCLRTGVDPIGQHIGLFHLVIGLQGCFQIFFLACIFVKQHRHFHQLVHRNAMHVELRVVQAIFLRKLRAVLCPGIFGQLQQPGILGDGVSPKDALHIHQEAVSTQFFHRVRKIILFQCLGNTRIACGFIIGLQGAEKYGKRPCHRTCFRPKPPGRAVERIDFQLRLHAFPPTLYHRLGFRVG